MFEIQENLADGNSFVAGDVVKPSVEDSTCCTDCNHEGELTDCGAF